MITLSARSRTTSVSYSFQPRIETSICTSFVRDSDKPRATMASNSSRL